MSLAPFGTAHEELEDEKNTGVSRKPKRIEDEIVTDEKGRRRFHGAFTGGFSAGYFNTAGSKEGWEPKTFKSTRNERADRVAYSTSDFMDEEDRGEFGFAHRQIRARDEFMEKATDRDGGAARGPAPLAWERAGPSTSSSNVGLDDIAAHLQQTIYPVNDSIGVNILKKMGWRPGKGIGPRMKRRALEKRKVIDARSRGESSRFDEKAVREIEANAPEVEFFPDDIPKLFFASNPSQHGVGYKPLEQSNVLDESFAFKVDALKTKKNSRGIRGQAFGVGVYEEDDDDIYTSTDLSKYDFAIGGDSSANVQEVQRYDSKFVSAKEPERPTFYRAPQPTKHFNSRHVPQPITLKDLPATLLTAVNQLTPLQRAVFLGDRSGSIMELLNDADRKKLELLSRKSENETTIEPKKQPEKRVEAEPFEEEPLKAHRFKKYIHYLKSGYEMPPPMEMTRLEWEREQAEFESHLPPELRALLPSVRSRQEPLANLKTAQPIADLLKSRFQTESTTTEDAKPESKFDSDRKLAVSQKSFGVLTRTRYKWHPSRLLCKYFNVENPYPDSGSVGTLELQKRTPATSVQLDSLGNLGLPNTQRDVIDRLEKEAHTQRRSRFDRDTPGERLDERDDKPKQTKLVEKPLFLPPLQLLQSVFELPDDQESSSSSSSDSEPEQKDTRTALKTEQTTEKPKEKFITILDLVPDDDEYGPRIPEVLPIALPPEEKAKIVPIAPQPEVVQLDSSDDSANDSENHRPSKKRRRSEDRKRSSKKAKKEKKHKSKSNKSKKSKKHRKRRHSSSSSSSVIME